MDDFSTLIIELEHHNAERRQRALDRIGELGEAALPMLRAALNLGHGAARARAAEVLAQFGVAALGVLEDALADPDPEARLWAVWTLARIDSPSVTPLLVRALADPELQVRRQAVEGLSALTDSAAGPALCQALRDTDGGIRQRAAEALGTRGDIGAAPPLCGALWDTSLGVRCAAIASLGLLGSRLAVPALLERLNDQNPQIRRAAAQALGKVRANEAIGPLVHVMQGRDVRLAEASANALVEIGTPAAFPVAAALLEMPSSGHPLAADVLVRIGLPSATCLCRLLESNRSSARLTAVRALRTLAQRQPGPQLRAALPLLRSRLGPLSGSSDPEKQACRAALQLIEGATREMQDLPLPAVAPARSTAGLPLPASGTADYGEELVDSATVEAPLPTEENETLGGYLGKVLRVFRREA